MARPSVSIKVITEAFPDTTKEKKTAKLMARIAKSGWPWPLPRTVLTDAAYR